MFSLSTMLPIRLAVTLAHPDHETSSVSFRRDALFALKITFPIVAAYCPSVALFAKHILRFVYGSTYAGYGGVLAIFAGYYLLLFFAQFAGALLTARRQTERLFFGNAVAALVSLAAAWPLIAAFGAEGAALLLALSAGVLTVALSSTWAGAVKSLAGARWTTSLRRFLAGRRESAEGLDGPT